MIALALYLLFLFVAWPFMPGWLCIAALVLGIALGILQGIAKA